MEIPPQIKKNVSPVTHLFWHNSCVLGNHEMTQEQKLFYLQTGDEF